MIVDGSDIGRYLASGVPDGHSYEDKQRSRSAEQRTHRAV